MMYFLGIIVREGELNVCDFGGALGSTYWQHRDLFDKKVHWNVVEQKNVEIGNDEFQNSTINFYHDVNNLKDSHINCVLMSGVLQYIDEKEKIIDSIISLQTNTIIIERTPVGKRQRISIQTVHEPIYEAEIPFIF